MQASSFFSRHGDDDDADADAAMDMGSSTSSSDSMDMKMYFHFSGLDTIWFSPFKPASPGAVFGACVFLVFLAGLYRWLHAVERMLVVKWTKMGVQAAQQKRGEGSSSSSGAPNWVWKADLPRGVYQVLISAVGYLLMLVVMTFNAYYFISILLGLGLGESLFGRFGRRAVTSAVPSTSDNSFSHSEKAGQSSQSNALVQKTAAAQRRDARDNDDEEANETADSEDQKHEDSSAIPLTTLNH